MAIRLTANDCVILCEALDAWVNKNAASEIMGDVLTHVVGAGDPRIRAALMRENQQQQAQGQAAKESRKEVATLLKATLIRMRRELEAEEAIGGDG